VLQDLVGVHHVERVVGVVERVHVAHGQVELSLRFRYFRSGSIGAGSKLIDETSEADFNALP